jgi:V/A-type H+/Na+-transporting ATPase subunit E
MEAQLKELIEKIRQDGVETAEQEAEKIIAEAKNEADGIIEEAHKKSKEMIENAKKENRRQEQAGKEALVQAGRDLLISLEKKITQIFDELIKSETGAALEGKSLENILTAMVKEWVKTRSDHITVLLPEDELKALEGSLKKKLTAELKKGVEIKPTNAVEKGFYISEKEGSSYYNFSAEGIAEIIAEYVNPRLSEAIRRAAERR